LQCDRSSQVSPGASGMLHAIWLHARLSFVRVGKVWLMWRAEASPAVQPHRSRSCRVPKAVMCWVMSASATSHPPRCRRVRCAREVRAPSTGDLMAVPAAATQRPNVCRISAFHTVLLLQTYTSTQSRLLTLLQH
jgi:hypothetical protein